MEQDGREGNVRGRKQDLVITGCQTQKDMKRLVGARSICLDVYGKEI